MIILQVRAQSQNKSIYLSLPSMLIPDSFRVVHAESQNSFVLGVFLILRHILLFSLHVKENVRVKYSVKLLTFP